MYSFENYLNEDLLSEDLLNEDLLESYDEAVRKPLGRSLAQPIRPNIRPQVTQQSNFGKNLSGNAADYATKSELKKALDGISNDVNELKKSSIATSKSIAALDAKHSELAKIDARKNDNQTKVLKNMQMMNMISSMMMQPKLNSTNLDIKDGKIVEKEANKSILIDPMSTMLPLITTMGDSGSGKSGSNDMMPILMMMMMQGSNNTSGTNNMMMPILAMTMMK